MRKNIKKRRKGGGRKFTDKRMTEKKFMKLARDWYEYDTSVHQFINKIGISYQSYYRFLNKNKEFKIEIDKLRQINFDNRKARIEDILEYYNTHPNSDYFDYVLDTSIVKVTIPKIRLHKFKIRL